MPFKDPQKYKEYQLKYKEEHREEARLRARKFYKENREQCRASFKLWQVKNPIKVMLLSAKTRAKEKGLEFNLTESDIKIPTHCPILGIELIFNKGNGVHTRNSPTLDRIDNTKGYTKENSQVISYKANAMKSNFTIEQIRNLYKYTFGEK